jgi:hypothetical protein
VTLGSESTTIHSADVVPVLPNEARTFKNTGDSPLAFLVIGVAKNMAAKDAQGDTSPAHALIHF